MEADLRMSCSSSCLTEMQPRYMYSSSRDMCSVGMSCSYHVNFTAVKCHFTFTKTTGCLDGFAMNRDLKYGLQAERTSLWAWKVVEAVVRLTSVKLFSTQREWKMWSSWLL